MFYWRPRRDQGHVGKLSDLPQRPIRGTRGRVLSKWGSMSQGRYVNNSVTGISL